MSAQVNIARFSEEFVQEMSMREEQSRANKKLLGQILKGQRESKGCLPFLLGLTPLDFIWLVQIFLKGQLNTKDTGFKPELLGEELNGYLNTSSDRYPEAYEKGCIRQDLLELRRDEWEELRELLAEARSGISNIELKIADIVAAACLGGDHLWRDLGFSSRAELGELLHVNFKPLAEKNTQDMKWKKFFYKQMCEQEGGYVCRAPSCNECAAYDDCFGPEE